MTYRAKVPYDYMHPSWYPALKLHGAFGSQIIFEQRKYGLRIRPYVYPYNPKTPLQQFWRDYFRSGKLQWDDLSEEEKQMYNKQAVRFKMSGYNRFMHLYLKQNAPFLDNF